MEMEMWKMSFLHQAILFGEEMEVTNVFFFLIICEPLYFLWDKLTQQRLASPATFINFLWQSLIPQQLGPTPAQGQSSPTLPAQPPSNYSGTLSESSNVKTWQGPPDRLSQLSAQLVQTVKVKSVVLFSLGRTGSIAVYIWLIAATKMRLGLFFKLDSCVLVFPFKQRPHVSLYWLYYRWLWDANFFRILYFS